MPRTIEFRVNELGHGRKTEAGDFRVTEAHWKARIYRRVNELGHRRETEAGDSRVTQLHFIEGQRVTQDGLNVRVTQAGDRRVSEEFFDSLATASLSAAATLAAAAANSKFGNVTLSAVGSTAFAGAENDHWSSDANGDRLQAIRWRCHFFRSGCLHCDGTANSIRSP